MQPVKLPRRLAAIFYDALLCLAVLFTAAIVTVFIAIVLNAITGQTVDQNQNIIDPGALWYQAIMVALVFFFYVGFWSKGGRTLGMKSWKFKVVDLQGQPIGFGQASLRFFATFVSLAPLGLGFWWGFIEPDGRCWHDRLSNTLLIRTDQ